MRIIKRGCFRNLFQMIMLFLFISVMRRIEDRYDAYTKNSKIPDVDTEKLDSIEKPPEDSQLVDAQQIPLMGEVQENIFNPNLQEVADVAKVEEAESIQKHVAFVPDLPQYLILDEFANIDKNVPLMDDTNKNVPLMDDINRNVPLVDHIDKNVHLVDDIDKNVPLVDDIHENIIDSIPKTTEYPGSKHRLCKRMRLASGVDAASIIIPFCGETLETLKEILTSLLRNTLEEMIHEVVFINGGCKTKTSHMIIEEELENIFGDVIFLRHQKTKGSTEGRRLIVSRTVSENLVFVDVNHRFTPDWLRPLLEVLEMNERTIAAPTIEEFDTKTQTYRVPFNASMTLFDWHLRPRLMALEGEARRKLPTPYETLLISSPAYAIRTEFYQHLSTHDAEIKSWGAAQLELSLKAGMCGGRVVEVPCSRLLLKRPTVNVAEESTDDVGYRRVIEIWMSRIHRKQIYKRRSELQLINPGDIMEAKVMKSRMRCGSFDGYLELVCPKFFDIFPLIPPLDFANGKIKSTVDERKCLTLSGEIGDEVFTEECEKTNQEWILSWRKVLTTPEELLCVDAGSERRRTTAQLRKPPTIEECVVSVDSPAHQLWRFDPETSQIQDGIRKRCLTLTEGSSALTMEFCNPSEKKQKWKFDYVSEYQIANDFPPFEQKSH